MTTTLACRHILMAACLMYRYGRHPLSDAEFDKMQNFLADNFNKLSAFEQWQLTSPHIVMTDPGQFKLTLFAATSAVRWWNTFNVGNEISCRAKTFAWTKGLIHDCDYIYADPTLG